MLIYADDVIITSSRSATIDDIICKLHIDFSVKDLETLNYFIGIKAVHSSDSCVLS